MGPCVATTYRVTTALPKAVPIGHRAIFTRWRTDGPLPATTMRVVSSGKSRTTRTAGAHLHYPPKKTKANRHYRRSVEALELACTVTGLKDNADHPTTTLYRDAASHSSSSTTRDEQQRRLVEWQVMNNTAAR